MSPANPLIAIRTSGTNPSVMKFLMIYLGVSIRKRNDEYVSQEKQRVVVTCIQKSS